uniref:Somatostatin/Cortistatin C-terminal domain-containing protein n=1 Tax=Meleagris gallopavo TaxID=9103 RepID=G1MZJ2_MELGA
SRKASEQQPTGNKFKPSTHPRCRRGRSSPHVECVNPRVRLSQLNDPWQDQPCVLTSVPSCFCLNSHKAQSICNPSGIPCHRWDESGVTELVASLVSVLLLAWSVRATALPGEERLALQNSREQTKLRRDALLKMLAGLLESADGASPDLEEEGKLEEERAALGRLAQLSQRDRKAPCKNFFWKTFTSC